MRIVCIIHVRLQIFYSYKIAKMIISSTPKIILCYSFQTLKLMNLSAKIYRPQYGDAGTLSRRVQLIIMMIMIIMIIIKKNSN